MSRIRDREPVAWIGGIVALVQAVIPVLVLFDVVDWNEEQIAAIVVAVGGVTSYLGIFFARRRVSPVDDS